MQYLSAEQVIQINETQVGPGKLRDRHLLDSAVERPRQSVGGIDAYPDIHAKAAALLQSLARNHPFLDGNKRTAYLADVTFYDLNGLQLAPPVVDEAVAFVVDVAVGSVVEVNEIAGQLAKWAEPL